ncbi:MAG: cation:proton antiporter, partial [Kiritimatiellia bacterium]
SLSRTDLLHEIRERLEGVYQLLVPVFFCVMGMLVNLRAMRGVLGFAVIFTLAAMAGKLLGCALPAVLRGFNLRGAWRIGAGMLPRGEVTLLVAGIGLASGVIGNDLFGVAFFTLLASAIIAPCLFARSLEGGSGLRPSHQAAADIVPERRLELTLPGAAVADFLRFRLEQAFRQEAFMVHRISREAPVYQIRKENIVITMQQEQQQLVLSTSAAHEAVMRLIVLEEIVALKDMLAGLQELQTSANFGNNILAGLFGAPGA